MAFQDEQGRQEEEDYMLMKEQNRRHDPHYDGHGLGVDKQDPPKTLPALTHDESLAIQAEYEAELLRKERQCQ